LLNFAFSGSVVPLAAHERGVPGAAERGGPRLGAHQLLVDVEQVLAGEQHRARGDAGRALHPTLHVGARERHAAPREPVEIRCLNDWIAERGDGIGALVIGEQEQHVRRRTGAQGQRADCYNQQQGFEHCFHGRLLPHLRQQQQGRR
jgi:hypothetical protein